MKSKTFFIVTLIFLLASCDLYKELPGKKVLLLTDVPDVNIDITPENYKYGQRICLTCEDSDAVIFYTVNGSIPNENNYSGAGKGEVYIDGVSDRIIKAVAKKNGYSGNILELNYTSNADLYLEDLGQGWILKYHDGRILKCAGIPLKTEWKESETFSGYSLYEETFNVDDLKNGKWQSENGEKFIPRDGRVFDSCMLIDNNTIVYRQDMMIIENGVDGYKNWFAADAVYYPGVLGTPAQGRFIILYNEEFQYNTGYIVQNKFAFTETRIILKGVTTGTLPEEGILKFGNYIYQQLGKSYYDWGANDYLEMDNIVGEWKYGNWSMIFKSNGYYTFNQGSGNNTRKYYLYGKYLVLEGIGGSFIYDKSNDKMTFINSSSQFEYYKK